MSRWSARGRGIPEARRGRRQRSGQTDPGRASRTNLLSVSRTNLLSVEHGLPFLTQQLFDGTSLGRLREVPEPDECNPPLEDRLAHPLIAQCSQLHLTLRSVGGTKSGLYIAGM